jgi:hypothetical protein
VININKYYINNDYSFKKWKINNWEERYKHSKATSEIEIMNIIKNAIHSDYSFKNEKWTIESMNKII